MPNWNANSVRITHKDPSQIDRIVAASHEEKLADTFVPCPEELNNENAHCYGGENAEAYDQLRAELNEKYGYSNAIEWHRANWGVKWDFGDTDPTRVDANTVDLSFDTPWGPPIEFYRELELQGFGVAAYYYEPGMAFCGTYINGVAEDYQIPGDPELAKQVIPTDIDERFGIIDSLIEYANESD